MNMISNFAAPSEFIERIASELKAVTTSWSRIGSALSEAEEVFGCDSDAFKQILTATKFSRSTATKLLKIARSERLRQHAKVFAKCQAWTTLYEVTTLSEELFADLLDTVSEGEVVTFGLVHKIKAARKEADPYKVAFTVRIDQNALKGGLVEGVEFERLMDLIAQIQDTVPYVRIDSVDRFDQENCRYMSSLQLEYHRLMRAHLYAAIKEYKKRSSEWKYYKPKKGIRAPYLGPYCDLEEVRGAFAENPLECFGALEYEGYEQAETWGAAEEAISGKHKRCAVRANKPFQHASPMISAAADFDDGCTVAA